MDFSPHLRDCSPVLPDEVIAHFMHLAGVDTAVPDVLRIFGMAAQKFISDVGTAALQHCSERTEMALENPNSEFVLTCPDLYKALEEFDDALCIPQKPEYYV